MIKKKAVFLPVWFVLRPIKFFPELDGDASLWCQRDVRLKRFATKMSVKDGGFKACEDAREVQSEGRGLCSCCELKKKIITQRAVKEVDSHGNLGCKLQQFT